MEKPKRAIAVRKTLITVTIRVPSFLVSLSENKLDIIVPPDIIMETIPIKETGTFKSLCIAGHPEPSRESEDQDL